MPRFSLAVLIVSIIFWGCDIPEDEIPSYNPKVEIATYSITNDFLTESLKDTIGTLDSSIVTSYDKVEFELSFSINFNNSEDINDPNIRFFIQVDVDSEKVLRFEKEELHIDATSYQKIITVSKQDYNEVFNKNVIPIIYSTEVYDEWEIEDIILKVYGRF